MADEPRRRDDGPLPARGGTPFDSLEGAYEYVGLLAEAIDDARGVIAEDVAQASGQGEARRVQALQIVAYKLEKLGGHVSSSRQILNDLRTLRRLLLGERRSG